MNEGGGGEKLCKGCRRDWRLVDQDWVHHISTLSHQRAIARGVGGGHGGWGGAARGRCIRITGCSRIVGPPYEIGLYLSRYGKLEEFVCPTSLAGTKPHEIFCLFEDEQSVSKILDVSSHRILGHQVEMELKYPKNLLQDEQDSLLLLSSNGSNGSKPSNRVEGDWGQGLKIEDQLPKLLKEIGLAPNEALKRTKMGKELQEILRQTFSNSFVFLYGTDEVSTAMKQDSVRLCVDPFGALGNKSQGVIKVKSDPMSSNLIFQILSTHQQDGSSLFKFVSLYSISPLAAFNVPEISFTFKDTVCKVQFENFASLQKSRLIKFLIKLDLRIWPILMMVRHWSASHGIFQTHMEGEEFENYTVILLLLFYLTKKKVIPSVAHLQQKYSQSPLVLNNINMSFCTDSKIVPPTKLAFLEDKSIRTLSTLSILKEFFQYFARVDLKDNVICTGIGELVPRKKFKPQMEHELPESIRHRYRFLANGDLKLQKLNTFTPMCLQDPLDLTENVTRGVDEVEVCQFQVSAGATAKKLKALMESSQPNLMDIFKSDDLKRKECWNQDEKDEEPPASKPRL